MAIFGNKRPPAKGISKEEASQRDYFAILGRHVGDVFKLNILFVLCNIIFIGAAVGFSLPYLMKLSDVLTTLMQNKTALLPPWPLIPFLFMGPFIAGLTYVVRNWAGQSHTFLVSDFFEQSRKNWKQGLALSCLATVVTYLFLTAVIFYLRSGVAPAVVLIPATIVAVIFLCMSFYTYPIAVTFDIHLKDVLKNAWILALAKLPQNMFFLVIIGAVHFMLIQYATVLWLVLMGLCLIAWSGYTINYYVWHVMQIHMMSQIEEKKEPEEESVFEDIRR